VLNDPVESVWADVGEAEIEEPEWVVNNILPVGLSLIVGPPKSYKSAVELALIMSACGIENTVLPADLSECEAPGRALALSMEAQAGVLRHTAKAGFGIDIPGDGRFLASADPWKFRLDQPSDMRELLEWADTLDAKVLAIDPLRNVHSLDENDSGGMIMMLQPLQQWAVKMKKSVIIVHHSRKLNDDKDGGKKLATANDIRGTSALLGMADAALSVTAKNHSGLIHIDGIFKRGEAWQRTIQLGVWGQTGVESISSETKMVYGLVATGLGLPAIATAMKLSKAEVLKCMTELKRLGALTGDGKVTSNGSTLVETAVRKYAPST
jgi:hypothetical protein